LITSSLKIDGDGNGQMPHPDAFVSLKCADKSLSDGPGLPTA
jgi:hypothetical protein